MDNFPSRFRHKGEQIYAGGAPDDQFLSFFKNTLGGRTVLSLDEDVGNKIDKTVKDLGLAHFIIGLSSHEPHITDNMKRLISLIRGGLLTSGAPIYIHCVHGRDRTSFAIALHRVMKQNWDCNAALTEAARYGYGQGISGATQKLWKSILCTKGGNLDSGKADDDIVQNMRDDFSMGNVPPAFNMQQSFAPEIDIGNQPSMYDPHMSVDDGANTRRRTLRRKMLKDVLDDNDIPMIGTVNNYGPIGGAGPVENSGIMQLL